jgi:hypothetical protein
MKTTRSPRLAAAVTFAFVALGAGLASPPATAAEVKLEFTVTVTVGKKNLEPSARAFVADLEREIATTSRSRAMTRHDLATLAETRVKTFESDPEHRLQLRGEQAQQPAKAEVEFSISITIKTGGKELSPADRAFLSQLEGDLRQKVEQGRLAADAVPAAVDAAMHDYAAKQPGRQASWDDRPNTTVMIKLTIKF